MNIYTIILDISILVVLCLTIMFCWKLNNRIIALQQNKAEMEVFIKSLDEVIINAHNSIMTLKETTEKADLTRQNYLAEANQLANDLSIMISSGNRLMQRSDENIKTMQDLLIAIDRIKDQVGDLQRVYQDNIKNKIN